MGITVADIAELMIDTCTFRLYDADIDAYVYEGYSDEIPDEYADLEVQTIDIPEEKWALTLNVSTSY